MNVDPRTHETYRVEAGEERVNRWSGGEHPVKSSGGGESQIERRGHRRDHGERVLDRHEEQDAGGEGAGHGVAARQAERVPRRPSQEMRVSGGERSRRRPLPHRLILGAAGETAVGLRWRRVFVSGGGTEAGGGGYGHRRRGLSPYYTNQWQDNLSVGTTTLPDTISKTGLVKTRFLAVALYPIYLQFLTAQARARCHLSILTRIDWVRMDEL
ncbi:60 kDa chaperonin [Striga asiatica]|uniref:60 kDa chaperonin n=1 Tax=Striga asiatica TaxID=4170 RepID=A0A5A7QG07_STRAF|nr:60 kDa chaperonin [Striga asiatica]